MSKIAASILSADFSRLGCAVQSAQAGGADYVHFDVMDGHFVPNLTVGAVVCKSLRAATQAVLDVHLMVENPSKYVASFAAAGADILTVHLEAPDELPCAEILKLIRKNGMKPGLSIKPNTPAEAVLPYLPLVDLVLVMTVEPGFGGQTFIPHCMEKIRMIRRFIDEINPSCELEIDGGVGKDNIVFCKDAGADVFVMGSAIFGGDPCARVRELKRLIDAEG